MGIAKEGDIVRVTVDGFALKKGTEFPARIFGDVVWEPQMKFSIPHGSYEIITQDILTVTSVEEYVKKWGYRGLSILLADFIGRAPSFQGEQGLASLLGEAAADLESALRSVRVAR